MDKYPDNINIQDDGTIIANVTVSIDDTWQKRGHSSKHGFIFLVSVETGEVVDYCVKTISCHMPHKKCDVLGMLQNALLILKVPLVPWNAKLAWICLYGPFQHEV